MLEPLPSRATRPTARLDRRGVLAGAAALAGGALAALPRPAAALGPVSAFPPPGVPDGYIGYVDVPRFFPQTEHNVTGDFFGYFRACGDLTTFGYPLTEEYWEPGGPQGHTAQYFQRGRLEFDLVDRVVRRSPLGEMMNRSQPAVPPLPGVRYFPQTGHNLGGAFLRFFVDEGGVDALGYPISEEVDEDGHTVQWFQNARLEWWPENPAGHQVRYGLIGAEHLKETARRFVPVVAVIPAKPMDPVREWVLPPPPGEPARALPAQHIPILYYHQVPAQAPLRAQIRAFKEAGRSIVPLSLAVAALRGEATLPPDPLALTFDDSWGTQFTNARPVLLAERVPATFFAITRFLGGEPGYMSWEQVRTLKEAGFDVESHTQNHMSVDDLRKRDEDSAVAEIWESLSILESRLGRSQRIFAYPNWSWDSPTAAIAARVYRAAVATGGGDLQSQDRLYALRRIKAEPTYSPESLLAQMG